ncbi:hypothetical protein ACIBPB_24900 [Micromonospora sp. NPDC049836]|uniref:hypothetical protein n=1 Tax=Micromonospora sp. NPDC049836 TaxID=3364274 RepID=UPI0037A89635
MTSTDAAPARPTRPGAVTVAYWLQLATVAVLLLIVCLVVVETVRYDAQIDEVLRRVPDADPAEVSGERAGNVFMACFMAIPALLLAGWLGATALPLRRGSNVARILVFVAGGAQLLLCVGQVCLGLLIAPLAMFAVADAPEFDSSTGMPPDAGWEESKFLETLDTQSDGPGAVVSAVGGLGVLLVLGLSAAVVVLLLLRDSRRWFGGEAPSGGPWPGYGYPPAAGYYGPYHPQPSWPTPPPGQPAWPAGAGQPFWPVPGHPVCPDPSVHFDRAPAEPATAAAEAGHPADPPPGSDTPHAGSGTPGS